MPDHGDLKFRFVATGMPDHGGLFLACGPVTLDCIVTVGIPGRLRDVDKLWFGSR